MTEQLKPLPCPFCGRTDIRAHVYGGGEPDAFMQCHDCSADGPNGLNRAGAIEAWNRRAQTAQAVPVLTDAEIHAADPIPQNRFDQERVEFARAVEAAVRAKMGVAVPMTLEQIIHLTDEIPLHEGGGWFVDVVRAAERHHGIVGKEGA